MPSRTFSRSTGRPRRPPICPAAACRSPARSSPIPRWRRPTSASSPRRRPAAARAKARWQTTIEAPICYDYGRYSVLKCGPWTQGLVTLQQLALAKGFDFDRFDPTGPDFIHFQVECAKLAFADRDPFYGDPKFVDVPVEALLSDVYNDARRKLITMEASHEIRPGAVEGFGKQLKVRLADGQRAAVAASGAGEPTVGDIPWTHDEDKLPDVIARQAREREKMGAGRGDTVHSAIL